MLKSSSGPCMLEHTVADAECIHINPNSSAKQTRSFHKQATKTGSKGGKLHSVWKQQSIVCTRFSYKSKITKRVTWNLSTARALDQTQRSQDRSTLQISRYRLYRQEDAQGKFVLSFLLRKSNKQRHNLPNGWRSILDNVSQHCIFISIQVGITNEEALGNTQATKHKHSSIF